MYLEHFAMRDMPFAITPDTSYFYNYGSHQEGLNVLLVALRSGEGFIKVSGEVGTGKTLLCRKVLNTLDESFVTAYLPNPCLTPAGLRMALADELEIKYARNMGQHRILKLINDRLIEINTQGKQVVLFLDEAQALPDDSMEALRLLTNLETEKSKLLQVVLFGQPELDDRLAQSKLRQLRQRITFSQQLQTIDATGIEGYLAHRLLVAGYHGKPLFQREAALGLHQISGGVPRIINVLAHKMLMAAYGQGASTVTVQHLQLAADDTEGVAPLPVTRISRVGAAVVSAMGAAAAAAAMSLGA
ncbi:MAG TPA: AAA family ATPase [Gammaproteobacteria bacterium]|nr:AAA family ATPase [Gammaproteobacteria bacterium]